MLWIYAEAGIYVSVHKVVIENSYQWEDTIPSAMFEYYSWGLTVAVKHNVRWCSRTKSLTLQYWVCFSCSEGTQNGRNCGLT